LGGSASIAGFKVKTLGIEEFGAETTMCDMAVFAEHQSHLGIHGNLIELLRECSVLLKLKKIGPNPISGSESALYHARGKRAFQGGGCQRSPSLLMKSCKNASVSQAQ
jgi:hypothetical protein